MYFRLSSFERYDEALEFFKQYKEEELDRAETMQKREEVMDHWPWDDMDEKMYM